MTTPQHSNIDSFVTKTNFYKKNNLEITKDKNLFFKQFVKSPQKTKETNIAQRT